MAISEAPHTDKERFLGRKEALAAVRNGFKEAIEPNSLSPRVCLIEGPAGVGKEHLLGELMQEALDDGATVLEAGQGGRSLGGLLPFLRTAVAEGEGRVTPSQLERMRRLLDEDSQSDESSPDVGEVVDFLLGTITTPTVFIVPSAHLQDPLTQACLHRIVRQLTPSTYLDRDVRPRCYWAISYAANATDEVLRFNTFDEGVINVHLEGFNLDDVTDFIVGVLGSQPLPAQDLHDLHQLTQGNPARVSDALFALREAGTLIRTDGGWTVKGGEALDLPESPQEIIRRRIGALSRDEVVWLQTLSVENRPFSMAYALHVTGGNNDLLHAWIERSILEQTWLETSLCLRFVSSDLRRELVETLPEHARQEAHEKRAAWIEAHLPTHEMVEHLAHHWAEAGKPARAISFFIASGQRSQSVGDLTSTIEWYRRAMVLLASLEMPQTKKLELEENILMPLGGAERANAEHLDAEERYRRLIEIAKESDNSEALGTALDRLALVLIETGRLTEAMESANERLTVAQNASDLRGQAMALRLVGVIRREMDGPAAGIEDLEEALKVADDSEEMADVRARIAIALSYAHTESGQPEEGLRWAMWGLKISRDANFSELEVSFLINISMAQFTLGRPDLTLRWATEAMEFCEARGLKRYHMLALGNAGDAMRALGHFDEAEQTLRAALRETYKTGGLDLQTARMVELGHLLMDKGDPEAAKTYLGEVWRLRSKLSNTRNLLALGLAELRLRLGTLCSADEGSCTIQTDELLANVMAWASTGTDTLPQLELMVYAGLFQASVKKKKPAKQLADEAYALSSELPPSRLISRPDLAAGMLALLSGTRKKKEHAEFKGRIARAIDSRAASIDDAQLRREYLCIPLIAHLSR